MPRIFSVTFTKEFEVTIVAESADEIEAALEKEHNSEFDDWTSSSDWEWNVVDPYGHIKKAKNLPSAFTEPDMGVTGGEALNIYDYKKTHPDFMVKIEQEARQLALRFDTEEKNLKLPIE